MIKLISGLLHRIYDGPYMSFFLFFSAAILFLYLFRILRWKHHWESYPEFKPGIGKSLPGISVVIPIRNELKNLNFILPLLEKQNYPFANFEVILVDDHSEDNPDALIQSFANPVFRYIRTGNAQGKKSALKTGIEAAVFELIVTTDADCAMNEKWLYTFGQYFIDNEADMIVGLVDMPMGKTFLEKYQEVEFLSLIASGAGAVAARQAVFCNAACFAFKKSVYLSLTDPFTNRVVSGDDTFFLHRAKEQKKKIMLLKSTDGIVSTHPQETWSELMNQRIRWASKSIYYRDHDAIVTAILVFLINFLFVISAILLFTGRNYFILPAIAMLKIGADYLFLQSFLTFYRKKIKIIRFIMYSFIYPLITVSIAICALIIGYSWKGRNYKPVI